jgi:hypothetical protein
VTDDQRIEALEQALRECAEAALDRIEVLEELLVECTEVLMREVITASLWPVSAVCSTRSLPPALNEIAGRGIAA